MAPEQIIGVVGAGTMGGGVAQIAAAAGHPVRLFDLREDAPEAAISGIATALVRLVDKGRMSEAQRIALTGRIQPCNNMAQLGDCALVIEAVTEELTVKRAVFAKLEQVTGPETILASNTSSLSITTIAAELKRPERLVGMHFFNPVPLMDLVEVVTGLRTDQRVADCVSATATAWGKHPVRARSTPGFIVNRVARPFYAEALRAIQEQATDVATLDAIMRDCGGFRMGPLQLTDLIGQDVNFAVTRAVFDAFYQDPRFTPSLVQQELVLGGLLGRKSGRGFYDYREQIDSIEPQTAAPAAAPQRITLAGEPGPFQALLDPLAGETMEIHHQQGQERFLEIDDRVRLAVTDGRSATQRTADEPGLPWVVMDLVLDLGATPRIAIAAADQASEADMGPVIGLFQGLGKAVSVIDDLPGMIVMRTVCMLANAGADAVNQGVCSAEAVDLAMQKGVNYPRGPLAWAQSIGLGNVVRVLDNLAGTYGEDRYRVSPLLRRADAAGGDLL